MSDATESDDLPQEIEAGEVTQTAAYLAGDGETFDGVKVHPWSGRRVAAAMELGLGSGSSLDLLRIIFTACASREEIISICSNRFVGVSRFLGWIEDHGCSNPYDRNWTQATEIAKRLQEAWEASRFSVAGSSAEKKT